MGFDALVALMIDRPDRQVAFEFLKRLLDFGELDVVLPEGGRVSFGEVGAQ